jgi:hypothetical protein
MGVISITLTPEGDDDVICEEIVDEYEYEKENSDKINEQNQNVKNRFFQKGHSLVDNKTHPSYTLVYDMLTGIKNAVVETYAKRASREEEMDLNYTIQKLIVLLPKDFTAIHKYLYNNNGVIDEDNGNLSPYQNLQDSNIIHSFRFTDYAPFVFFNIRSYFGFNTGDYLDSLTKNIALHELKSPGKSGAFFLF